MENILAIIGTGFTILFVVGTAWVKLNVSIAEIRTRLVQLEKEVEHEALDNSRGFMKMDDNFKELFKSVNRIEVAMQNKEDRK